MSINIVKRNSEPFVLLFILTKHCQRHNREIFKRMVPYLKKKTGSNSCRRLDIIRPQPESYKYQNIEIADTGEVISYSQSSLAIIRHNLGSKTRPTKAKATIHANLPNPRPAVGLGRVLTTPYPVPGTHGRPAELTRARGPPPQPLGPGRDRNPNNKDYEKSEYLKNRISKK